MTFLTYSKKYLSEFLDLIYPQSCAACEVPLLETETHICMFCQHNLFINPNKDRDHSPLLRFAEQPIDQLVGLMRYSKKGLSQELINKVKYYNDIHLGFYLGQELGKQIADTTGIQKIDYLIPVPLHEKKLKKRGYNQAEEIAKGIADFLTCPIKNDVLKKVVNNKTQTKKGRISRWKNTETAYQLQPKAAEILKGKNILLIDDVLTSGATLTSCVKQINLAEVNKKYVAVLAIAENTQ